MDSIDIKVVQSRALAWDVSLDSVLGCYNCQVLSTLVDSWLYSLLVFCHTAVFFRQFKDEDEKFDSKTQSRWAF